MTLADYWVLVANTRTGAVLDELPVSDFSWTDSLDLARSGSMSVTVPLLGGSQTDERTLRVRTRSVASGPWFVSLVLVRRGRPLWAGPLVTYAAGNDSVSFTCASIFALLARRMVIAAGYELRPGANGADLVYQLSQRAAAHTLLSLGMTGSARALPFSLPAVPLLGDVTRTYLAADLASVTERLTQLSHEDGGPDVRVRPALDNAQTQLTWTFDIGTPQLGATPAPWTWDYPTSILDLTEDADASGMTFTGYVPGQAPQGMMDADTAVSRPIGIFNDATLTGAGWPSLEVADRSTSSVSELVLLDRQAKSLVQSSVTPTLTWKVTVDPEQWPAIGEWSFGDNAQIAVNGHPWVPDGTYTRRLLGVTHKPGTAELEITDPLPGG